MAKETTDEGLTELICFEVEPGRVQVRPAATNRDWMDASPGRFAYRCLPITMANSHGWEILSPADFEIEWDGGDGVEGLSTHCEQPIKVATQNYLAHLLGESPQGASTAAGSADYAPAGMIESHFGGGIVTFNPLVILRTAPGYNLWVSGPVNHFKDGVQALTALIETDWMPFTFSVNWKVTRPNTRIRFERDEPICSFFPVPRGVVDNADPTLRALSDDAALEKAYWSARTERNLASMAGGVDRSRFQGWYAKGVIPDSGVRAHAAEAHSARQANREEPPRPSQPRAFNQTANPD